MKRYYFHNELINCLPSTLKTHLNNLRLNELKNNLKRNWYFPISTAGFLCLNSILSFKYLIGIFVGIIISIIIASVIPSIWNYTKTNSPIIQLLSFLTAFSISFCNQLSFITRWQLSPKTQCIESLLPSIIDFPKFISLLGAVTAFFFIYFCASLFWKNLKHIYLSLNLFHNLTLLESMVYISIIIFSISATIFTFTQTDAFYGHGYDIIYTSDPVFRTQDNVYMALTHPENDLRQPLFAVFAAPFVSIPWLFGKISGSIAIEAILINSIQLILLFSANFMLAKMLNLNNSQRIYFMLFLSFTYTNLLFSLMMEQYVVAYFWLILCIYCIFIKQLKEDFVIYGAGGTLLTSMILLPLATKNSPLKNFKEWFQRIIKHSLGFIALMLFFGRLDVFLNLSTKISALMRFTGRDLSVIEKFYQYTEFIPNLFFAPNSNIKITANNHISWQLNPITDINFFGIIILLLVLTSAVLNRDKKICKIAGAWVLFSIVILFVIGWGTKENGLILYSLYFGWAFFLLFFQLIINITNITHIKLLLPIINIIFIIYLASNNIPEIINIVNFAISYFPS